MSSKSACCTWFKTCGTDISEWQIDPNLQCSTIGGTTSIGGESPGELARLFAKGEVESRCVTYLACLTSLMLFSQTVLSAATRLQRKYQEAPTLDLRAKKRQINGLLDQVIRDAKISFIKERSNREELLSEIIHSLTGWLNDIWTVVYVHCVNFDIAHQCLVFVADALAQLSETSSLGGYVYDINLMLLQQLLRYRYLDANAQS